MATIAHTHLAWIKKHPEFVPETGMIISNGKLVHTSYYAEMTSVYTHWMATVPQDKWEKLFTSFRDADIKYHKRITAELHKIEKEVLQNTPIYWFVTVNCEKTTPSGWMDKTITHIRDMNWVQSFMGVIEFFGKEGDHRHFHMLIKANLPYKSNVVDAIWAVAGIKKYCNKKTFIDVKPGLIDEHVKYLKGEKEDSKMARVERDRKMRYQCNLPDLYQKCY